MVHFYSRIIIFVSGILLGVLIASRCINYDTHNAHFSKPYVPSYKIWFENFGFSSIPVSWDSLRYSKRSYELESNILFSKVKVLCIILIRKEKNAKAASETWAKKCNNISFIVVNKINKLMPVKRKPEHSSWVLLCNALKNTLTDFNWFLVVNDNTFVILENLRYYLAVLDASQKYYLGHAVTFWNTVYNSGQAGYVLSQGTLRAFKESFTNSNCLSNAYWNREDFYLGKHLAKLKINPVDTRDSEGLSTFHPYNWYQVFFPGESYYKTSVYPTKCCSKNSITFQAIEGDKIYMYYYLLYKLQIFMDGHLGNLPPIQQHSDDQVWKNFLKERNIPSDNVTSEQYYKIWENLIADPNSFAAQMKKETHFDYD